MQFTAAVETYNVRYEALGDTHGTRTLDVHRVCQHIEQEFNRQSERRKDFRKIYSELDDCLVSSTLN